MTVKDKLEETPGPSNKPTFTENTLKYKSIHFGFSCQLSLVKLTLVSAGLGGW